MSILPRFLTANEKIYNVRSKAAVRPGQLPLTEEMLLHSPSGDLFGFSQNAGMGWDINNMLGPQVLILSTMGGLRKENGEPLALGFHTGHWELGLLVRDAAIELKKNGLVPFAAYCSDPCDGRTQGTSGMLDSLAYRNTGAEVLGRLVRSLPTGKGLMGVATCDKGLPAMMMALAEAQNLPGILVPGGVTLPPEEGEDAGVVQSIGTRFAHGELTLDEAAALGCAACASPGGGCQFLGTAASSQVIGEALGMSLPHSALAPSGEEVWLDLAPRSALALGSLMERNITMSKILTVGAIRNAMAVHAAVGGSTNLLLHLPAIAFSAGLERPVVEDWIRMNSAVPRIVDVLPNGPVNFKTVQLYLAGGVPEIMLHLRSIAMLDLDALTVTGMRLGDNLEWWEKSDQRRRFREILKQQDGVDADRVIMGPAKAKECGLARTVIFPAGNLCPEGSVVKSTSIEPSLFKNGVYQHQGPARVFISEDDAIAAIKSEGDDRINPGEIIVLVCRGPLGAGLPETSQITMALKYTKALKNIPLLTDGRFSGFSSGPCIGHVGPEALSGGPIGKIRDGDIIELHLNTETLEGKVNLLGERTTPPDKLSPKTGSALLAARQSRPDLAPDPRLPTAVRLWALLQSKSGGTWGGCVYDYEAISAAMK